MVEEQPSDEGVMAEGYKARSTAPVSGAEVPDRKGTEQRSVQTKPAEIERRAVRREPSRYAKRSAHLPHLGDDVDHDIIDEMEILRADSPQR